MPFICVKTCGWIPCKLVNDKKTNKNKRLIKSQSWHDSCESISELEYFGIRMMVGINTNCSIPDVCIDERRLPLFIARATLRGLIAVLEARTTGDAAR